MRIPFVVALTALATVGSAQLVDSPHHALDPQRLPEIASAPEFTLISQDNAQVSLADLRGKVVAVTFVYTLCGTTCPVITPMMSLVADRLGADFGRKIAFISITIDPERDTPETLKLYAQTYGAAVTGWNFLTGDPAVIQDLIRRYGLFASKDADGQIEHSLLTSIADSRGILRVQYLGAQFDPDEFRRDLLSLVEER
ncbi:MAG TPA: SCO family protein [Xanthobacteraceae bacterium]